MKITYSDFIKTINENTGEVLATSGARATFRLEESSNGVRFTLLSSAKPRELNQLSVQRYLDVFNETQSTTTAVYTEKMRNASYVLAIIKLWMGQLSDAPLIEDGALITSVVDPNFSAPEGEVRLRSHWQRERRRDLVEMAKELFRINHHDRLFCEVCDFDFGKAYGDPDFIEAHHRTPLRDLQPGATTKLSDLAMVCANCHRMLHRGNPWPTVDALKQLIEVYRG